MLGLGLRKVRDAGEARHIALVRGDAMRLPGRRRESLTRPPSRSASATCRRPTWRARWRACCGREGVSRFSSSACRAFRGFARALSLVLQRVLPLVGRAISGHSGAYSYLPASVGAFPPPAEFVTLLRHAGFTDVRAVPLTFGSSISMRRSETADNVGRCTSVRPVGRGFTDA